MTRKDAEMKRTPRALTWLLAALMAIGATATTVDAKGPISGAGAVVVTCSLPEFPSPGNTTSCSGTGTFLTTFVDDKNDPGTFTSTGSVSTGKVQYFQPCTAGEAVFGFATGFMEASGAWHAAKNGLNGHPAHISIPFDWMRLGAIAIVTTGKLSGKGKKTILDLSTGQTATDLIGDIAVGLFIPLGVPAPCSSPQPLDVLIPAVDYEIA